MNSNQEIKKENREIVLRCCWATYCSKASRRGIPPSSLMSLLASASSASWTMIQTYITQKGKFNLSVNSPDPPYTVASVTCKHFMYVLTKPLLSRYFFWVGCRFMEVSIIITGFVPFFEQKIHGLFKDFQGHISQTKAKWNKLIQIFQRISLLKETKGIKFVFTWQTHLHKNKQLEPQNQLHLGVHPELWWGKNLFQISVTIQNMHVLLYHHSKLIKTLYSRWK